MAPNSKQQPELNLGRLVKILELTNNESDNEALAALRKALKIMADAGITHWGDLFDMLQRPAYISPGQAHQDNYMREQMRRQQQAQQQRAPETDAVSLQFFMASQIKSNMSESEQDWIDKLYQAYRARGCLTPRQLDVLADILARHSTQRAPNAAAG